MGWLGSWSRLLGLGFLGLAACRDRSCESSGGVGELCSGSEVQLIGLELTPSVARLQVQDGVRPSQSYTLIGIWSDGHRGPAPAATYQVRPVALGLVDPTALVFTASGKAAGTGTLQARLGDLVATATLAIEVNNTEVGPGIGSDELARFSAAGVPEEDGAQSLEVVYPLDGVLMPQSAAPVQIQWSGGEPGEILRIRWEKPALRITNFLRNDGPLFLNAYRPTALSWRTLSLTTPGELVELRVDRLTAEGRLYASRPVRLRFAEAALEGVIYFRSIKSDQLLAIDNRGADAQQPLPKPPLGCTGCHTISGSGRYFAARFGTVEDAGGVLDLTGDLSSTAAVSVFQASTPWWHSTFSPDDRRVLVSLDELGAGGMALYDLRSGEPLTPLEGGLPTGLVSQPSWSPDGSAIAYLANLDTWGGLNTTGDLFLLPVLGLDRFGTPTRRVAGEDLATPQAPGRAISYPSWSPDSRWLAFALGTSADSKAGASALYLVQRQDGAPQRLERASGQEMDGEAYDPQFAPTQQGGYSWLCYLSRRDYGNQRAGSAGSGRQQVWVSAIRTGGSGGADPSEVGYWLEGQDPSSVNIAPYWAPRACRADAEACARAEQCCSGACGAEGRCQARAESCRAVAESCFRNADCCDGVLCLDRLCGGID